jgi:hypothetical protein
VKYQRRQSDHIPLGGVVLRVNRFTLGTWPLWYFLGMRGLTILFVTFAALLVMRGQQQPHFALRPTAPMPAVNVP